MNGGFSWSLVVRRTSRCCNERPRESRRADSRMYDGMTVFKYKRRRRDCSRVVCKRNGMSSASFRIYARMSTRCFRSHTLRNDHSNYSPSNQSRARSERVARQQWWPDSRSTIRIAAVTFVIALRSFIVRFDSILSHRHTREHTYEHCEPTGAAAPCCTTYPESVHWVEAELSRVAGASR